MQNHYFLEEAQLESNPRETLDKLKLKDSL